MIITNYQLIEDQLPESVSATGEMNNALVFLRSFPSGPSALQTEARLYKALAQLEPYTPHIAQLKSKFVLGQEEWQARMTAAGDQSDHLAQAVDTANFRTGDRIITLVVESSPETLESALEENALGEEQLLEILFQTVWTLVVLHWFGIRHGRLDASNILLVREPFRAAYVLDPEDSEYYQLDGEIFVKLGNWLWGGVYPREDGGSDVQLDPIQTAFPSECRISSSCGQNSKVDLYTLLSSLPIDQLRARGFDRVIDLIEYTVHPDLGNGPLCKGKYSVDGCQVDYRPDAECTGPWEPPDCLVKSPADLLAHPTFSALLQDRANPPQGPVYGMWQTTAQQAEWQRFRAEPQPQLKVCSLSKRHRNRSTIRDLRKQAKANRIPFWANMSYDQLCHQLGHQLVD